MKGNGWNDIGYNFLVDRFGQVYEGRYGGIERNVIGAHAQGFNTGSVGVSVLGEYSSLAVSAQARDALERLLAWRLDLAHVDPASDADVHLGRQSPLPVGHTRVFSGPSRRTATPASPTVRATGSTASSTRSGATSAAIGLPKLYAPTVTGTVPGLVRFRARLSSPLPWTIEVLDDAGQLRRDDQRPRLDDRLDVGRLAGAPRGRTRYAIRGGGRPDARGRHDRRRRARARVLGPRRRSADGHAERRRRRRHGDDLVHAERPRGRHRRRPGRRRRSRRDPAAGLEARGDAEARLRSRGVAGRDLRRRARRRRRRARARPRPRRRSP